MQGKLKSKGKVMGGKHVGQSRRALRNEEIAALLGWLGDPWVDRLERSGRSRTTAVVLVFTLMLLLLVLSLVIAMGFVGVLMQRLLKRHQSAEERP